MLFCNYFVNFIAYDVKNTDIFEIFDIFENIAIFTNPGHKAHNAVMQCGFILINEKLG